MARLRPARVGRSLARRLFERRIARAATSARRVDLRTLGTGYGGWTVPADALSRDAVCYCVGAGSDVSFDLALAGTFGCQVWCLDPGEDAEDHVLAATEHEPLLTFRRLALAADDGAMRLFRAGDPASGSLSAVNLLNGTETVEDEGRSLPSLMAEHGHDRVDLLKLDIEGAEYDVLESLHLPSCGVRILCVEFHHTVGTARARRLMERLGAQGFAIVSRSGADFTLVRTSPANTHSRARTAGGGAGAVAVGYAAAASLWCGSVTGILCASGLAL